MSKINKIKVLIVDDSAFMRTAIERMLVTDSSIEIIGSARNGREAVGKVARLKPDVVTMDIEMPVMDGLHALKEIMRLCPTPVLMVSSLTQQGAKVTLDALELGAIDYIPKPGSALTVGVLKLQKELLSKIHAVANCKPKQIKLEYRPMANNGNMSKATSNKPINKAFFIGASTGGPPAVQKIVSQLSHDFPAPVIIAQHMPKTFTSAFATRLNRVCAIRVKEACDGEIIQNSLVYICPGDNQTRVIKNSDGSFKFSVISNNDEKDLFAPCINTLFFSAATELGLRSVAILLTGMGEDGVRGMKNIKMVGGLTITQDRATSVVYGMPKAALEQNAATRILSLDEIAPEMELAVK